MVLKPIRISRHLSQDQLAMMSGLNVRTIQRIESGSKASSESLKCLAAALEVDIETLTQETYAMEKNTDNWQQLPLFLKCWFFLNFLQTKPKRAGATRIKWTSHVNGFIFCCLGWRSEPALAGGLIMLAMAYLFHFLIWHGDKYGIWYDIEEGDLTR